MTEYLNEVSISDGLDTIGSNLVESCGRLRVKVITWDQTASMTFTYMEPVPEDILLRVRAYICVIDVTRSLDFCRIDSIGSGIGLSVLKQIPKREQGCSGCGAQGGDLGFEILGKCVVIRDCGRGQSLRGGNICEIGKIQE